MAFGVLAAGMAAGAVADPGDGPYVLTTRTIEFAQQDHFVRFLDISSFDEQRRGTVLTVRVLRIDVEPAARPQRW